MSIGIFVHNTKRERGYIFELTRLNDRRKAMNTAKQSKRQNVTKVTVAGFGAALAANYGAPELQAGIVTLDFSPGSVAHTNTGTLNPVNFNSSQGALVGGFSQWNDNVGKSFSFNGNLKSWAVAASGETINDVNFSGTNSGIYFTANQTGTVFIGFRALPANGGGIGWFKVSFGDGIDKSIKYNVDGLSQLATAGETLTVGSSSSTGGDDGGTGGGTGAVPEPGTATIGLSLLALGAAGLRRRRSAVAMSQ